MGSARARWPAPRCWAACCCGRWRCAARWASRSRFLEELWSRNLGHVFVSPLRPWELVAALIGMSIIRMLAGVLPAILLAWALYAFNLFALGPVLVLFFANLMIMGWWVALARGVADPAPRRGGRGAGLVGAVRPDPVLRGVLSRSRCCRRRCARRRPGAGLGHVFEGMRAVLLPGVVRWDHLAWAFGLNVVWLAGAALLFARQFRAARVRGALLSIGE